MNSARRIFLILTTAAVLFGPSLSHAGSRVYVGVGVGTAIVVGSGVASFNIGVNQRISEQKPEADLPPALAEITRDREPLTSKPFPDLRIDSPIEPPRLLRLELPLFILRW